MTSQATIGADEARPSNFALFFRLTRAQFLPLIILPSVVGTLYAFRSSGKFDSMYFLFVLVGVVLLHLGANAIDDAYDYQNGVDSVANSIFPKDFGGWKPIPRGYISLRSGKIISYSLLSLGLVVALYFWRVVGIDAFVLALSGTVLAIVYCAPPLKLDYRGLALGEAAIFFSFGPIPLLGAYYVQTGQVTVDAFLISVPIGLLTVTILMDHDLIFYEVYRKSRKYSLATILGKKNALAASAGMSVASYLMIIALVAGGILPIYALGAPIVSMAILMRKRTDFKRSSEPPPFYVPFTVNALLSDWLFSLALAIAIAI
jgi:1,4-dihydroxy-2-naphthoate polyprenyltransferase